MVDTGIRLKRPQPLSGMSLTLSLVAGIVALIFGASWYLRLVSLDILLLPLLFSMIGAIAAGNFAIPILQRLKTGQIVREDGPQAHLQKNGTPTMGGIFILPVGIGIALLWSGFNAQVLAASVLTLAYGAVGWLDDWQILRYKSNKGISPLTKLALLGAAAVGFCVWMAVTHTDVVSNVSLPLQLGLPLGILIWPLAMFVLMGTSNATNLTDGLDGLAAGTGAIALIGLAILMGNNHPELAVFCACMSGSYMGFLWHNRNPAKVFMGDTGSLALGGALAASALLGNMLWGLAIVGAIFIWESISVIAQVTYFKATKNPSGVGKRLFRMAPYHHHLELSGWRETQVVGAFYVIGMLAVLVAVLLKLL